MPRYTPYEFRRDESFLPATCSGGRSRSCPTPKPQSSTHTQLLKHGPRPSAYRLQIRAHSDSKAAWHELQGRSARGRYPCSIDRERESASSKCRFKDRRAATVATVLPPSFLPSPFALRASERAAAAAAMSMQSLSSSLSLFLLSRPLSIGRSTLGNESGRPPPD